MKSQSVQDVITKSISSLENQGFNVKGITSDQGSNLVRAFKLLGHTPSDPRIHIEDRSYVVFRDPPHLIKSARNFLLNDNVHVPAFEAPASWNHIIDFHKIDSTRSIKFAPRISETHLYGLKFANKMKVKLATQVMSNSCAAALDVSVALNELNSSAAATSTYLKKFNDLFDVFNSTSFKDKVILRKPYDLQQPSTSSKFLDEAKTWLLELERLNSKRRSKFISGWLENITALSLLSEDLRQQGMKFLCIRSLCQDPLELHFGKIRQMKRYPNAKDFADCFSRTATASLLRAPTTGNCEEALVDHLHDTEDLLSNVSMFISFYLMCIFQ